MTIHTATERMLLRRFTPDDLGLLVELDSDPLVMHHINGGFPTPPEVVRDKVLPRILGYYERYERLGFWAAVDPARAEFLGWFHFRPPTTAPPGATGTAELGYRLRRAAWGRGYAAEGARALIRTGFTDPGLHRVTAITRATHSASRRVMEKSGLSFRRVAPDSGGDIVEYALDRTAWARRVDGHGARDTPATGP
ncbi:GNAT family N-acetyltransferase [Nocardiopsis mangrovi]|uniref:GNAT family N-acetyltransferase n=1 Tax=Nocardiopsis mangrovi TaxID=1179818 RepID=A0ABV9DWA6_9ACTN